MAVFLEVSEASPRARRMCDNVTERSGKIRIFASSSLEGSAMEQNMGKTDRIIRAVIGALLIILAFASFVGAVKWIALIVGLVMLATAATSRCPAYSIFGIKTCER
jgi:hypothetical protein